MLGRPCTGLASYREYAIRQACPFYGERFNQHSAGPTARRRDAGRARMKRPPADGPRPDGPSSLSPFGRMAGLPLPPSAPSPRIVPSLPDRDRPVTRLLSRNWLRVGLVGEEAPPCCLPPSPPPSKRRREINAGKLAANAANRPKRPESAGHRRKRPREPQLCSRKKASSAEGRKHQKKKAKDTEKTNKTQKRQDRKEELTHRNAYSTCHRP